MTSRRGFLTGAMASMLAPAVWAEPRPVPRPIRDSAPAHLLAEARLGGAVAWVLIDVESGAVLESREPDLALPPASTLKAVTALYALDRLGPDFRFETRVLSDGDALVLAGYGDPVLDTEALQDLARQAAGAGLSPPARFLVSSAWPAHEIAELTPGQAPHLPYNPTISGLNLNFNRVHLDWRGGAGNRQLSLEARGSRLSPRAYTIAIRPVDRRAPLFTYDGTGPREEWTVAAQALGQPGSRWLPVRRPALYAGDVFQTLARAEGLTLPGPRMGTAGPDSREVARHLSPPAREMIVGMLDYSTNLTAEMLGMRASQTASPAASAALMAGWLREQGAAGAFTFSDHSGLSPGSRVTAAMMARLVAGYGRAQGLPDLVKAFRPVDAQGKRGDWPEGVAVMAKTGTLNFVCNLAGYAQGARGRALGFAILCADIRRRTETEGQELPEGVAAWTTRARRLQTRLLSDWTARYG